MREFSTRSSGPPRPVATGQPAYCGYHSQTSSIDGVGNPLTMTGFKLVKDDAGFDVWKDTTTLYASDRDVFVFLVDESHSPSASQTSSP